jgi:Zn-dependent protease
MRATFHLGRIAGIPVGVNWSVLVIFALVAWGLAAGRFPLAYPGHSAWTYALTDIAAAVVFFAGLLAHELAHGVVATRNGLRVESITLWFLGGVAQLQAEPRDPGAELRIAGAGPLVSFLLAVIFGGIAAAIGLLAGPTLTFGTFAWLAAINLVLAVFNVLPAAPLDGGRLLRAALWKWRGDRAWAAIVAARAGRLLGALLIGIGLWQLLFSRTGFAGLWLAVLGWFLLGAAAAEERQVQVTGALAHLRVRDVMSPQPQTAPPDITVAQFLEEYLFRYRFSSFPLLDEGHLVGLVTLARIKSVPPDARARVRLGDIACPMDQVAVAAPDDPLPDLLPRLACCTDGRALVLADGVLVGIVSLSDVTRALDYAGLRRVGVA